MSSRAVRAALLSLVALVAGAISVVLVAAPADAAYPGADGRIAFVRANQVYTATAAGGTVTKLTSSAKNYRPRWSPNGRQLSYVHEVNGRRDVWVMLANGGSKQAVTRSGDVTSAGATWSPDGRTLAFATTQLQTIRSSAPFGSPTPISGIDTGGFCGTDTVARPVSVDRFLAWSPDGTRISVFSHDDCYFDDRIDAYYVATHERRQYAASGADCCGYLDWSELFWGPGNQLGYSQRDTGQYGEDVGAPSRIVYPGFSSLDGDTGGAPSPSGRYLALTNASSGTARIFRVNVDGTQRRLVTTGYQPDWQPVV